MTIFSTERKVITMSAEWTEKQLQAINAENTAVIVSAAAGSGKTSVLVERLLRQLSDTRNKIPADRIIVVTFTNDAAAQMKQRLSAQLSKQIEKEPENMWLYQQQSLIQSAKISTIHSFCFDLIRDNIQSLDISAGFRVLDETEEKIIRSKAVSNVMENFCHEDSETFSALSDFFCGAKRSDTELENTILSIYNFIMSIPFYEDWLNNCVKRFENGFSPETDSWAKDYLSYLRGQYKTLAKRAESAAVLCEDIEAEKALDIVNNEAEMFNTLAENTADSSLEWDERIYSIKLDWQRISFPKSEPGSYEKNVSDQIKDIRNKYKDRAKKIVDEMLFSEQEISDDYARHSTVVSGLTRLVINLCTEIQRIKAEKNALGFSDAEQLAVKLLASKDENGNIVKTPLAKELSEYYKVIMIDEYQDSNNTQDLIFKLISHNGTSDTAGDNLFVVGDVKQSIYRFRLANPQIFINSLEKADRYTDDYTGTNASILLNRNFRSSGDVVGFVNYIFTNIMSKDVGEIAYTDNEKLIQGATFDNADRTTEIIIVPTIPEQEDNHDENDTDSEEQADILLENHEAKATAEKIHSLIGAKTITDKDVSRPCEPKDFCILLRDRKRAASYIEELSKLGIIACSEEADGYLDSREISVLLNLLTVTDNPLQDIPLASVLMSPMFMITADEIAKIRLLSENKNDALYKAVLSATDENESYYPKLKNFLEVLEKLRYCSASQSLERLIRTAYDSTDFLSVVQLYKDGEQKKANLHLLLEYAKSYEQNSKGGLSGFIRYIKNIFEQGGDFRKAATVSASDNVVSIKTIHKSKGLEFPFVFLCGTSKRFNFTDFNSRMQINSDHGLGFKIQDLKTLRYYNSFPHTIIKMHNRRNSISEEMRLLYVALTRAKEQLFITIADNDYVRTRASSFAEQICTDAEVSASLASSALCMQDWIIMALLRHPDCNQIRELFGSCETMDSDINIKETYYKISAPVSETKQFKKTALPDSEMRNKLKNYFNFSYDNGLSELPAKLTVTEIVRQEHENEITLRTPEFVSVGKLTSSEAGTTVHTFMQYSDFNEAENNIENEILRLYNNGIVTHAQKQCLENSIPQLRGFFDSNMYKRIKTSKNVRREYKFLVEISALSLDDFMDSVYNNTKGMLQGIADCIFEESDGFVLLDYKTDRFYNEDAFAERYKRQLELYSAALSKIFGKEVKQAYVYSFSLNKEILIK